MSLALLSLTSLSLMLTPLPRLSPSARTPPSPQANLFADMMKGITKLQAGAYDQQVFPPLSPSSSLSPFVSPFSPSSPLLALCRSCLRLPPPSFRPIVTLPLCSLPALLLMLLLLPGIHTIHPWDPHNRPLSQFALVCSNVLTIALATACRPSGRSSTHRFSASRA